MSELIPEVLLSKLSEVVLANTGLHFPKEKWQDLCRAVGKVAAESRIRPASACAQWILEPPGYESRLEALTKYLTVGETHFFRDGKLFKALEEELLPSLVVSRGLTNRTLRIWSAGCATGEEPYSIAIMVSRLLKGFLGWNFSILGTDINGESLSKAIDGVYGEWSFRSVPAGIREFYFEMRGDEARLSPEIKKMVRFTQHNLAKDPYPAILEENTLFDVIFCRNVIMYFTLERQERVINALCNCLEDGGLLVVSPAEASSVNNPYLAPVNCPGVIVFRKESSPVETKLFQPELFLAEYESIAVSTPEIFGEPIAPIFFDPVECVSETPTDLVDSAELESELTPYVEGLRLYEQGRYAEAVEQLILEVSSNGFGQSGTAISLLTRAFANQGKLDEALAWSEKAVVADKLNADYHHLHATILQEMGKNEEAVLSMNRAVFLNPHLVAAHFALGNLLRRMGNRKRSDRHFKTALTLLDNYRDDDTVPSTEGMSAGRLTEIILSMIR